MSSAEGRISFEELQAYRSGLRPHEIADELHKLVATRRRGLWLICRYLADLAWTRGYRSLDCDSIHQFAWRELGMTRDQVNRKLRVGRALRDLPRIEEAFVLGEIGFARVREIIRVATPETEAFWLERARHLSRRDLEAEVSRARGVVRADDVWSEEIAPAPDGEPKIRIEMPASLWNRLEAAMALAMRLDGGGKSEVAAMEQVADAAMARLQAQGPAECRPPSGAANDDGAPGARPTGRAAGHEAEGSGAPRPAVMAVGAACPGAGQPIRREEARPVGRGGPEGRAPQGVSEPARRLWAVLDHYARSGDLLMDAAGLENAPEAAAALVELEMAGFAEKVSGGWRRHRRQVS